MIAPVVMIISSAALGQVGPFTHAGSLTDQLRSPGRVAVAPDGTVLVTDAFHDHIVRFDATGNFLGTWAVAAGAIGVAAHPDGRFFVSLRDVAKVAVYDNAFTFVSYLGEGDPLVAFVKPTDIDIATDTGRIYVVDSDGHNVYAFHSDESLALMIGVRGHLPGQFIYPTAIAVDENNNRLIVADQDNFRVQVFTAGGALQGIFGSRMRYTSGVGVGWMPRTLGLTADSAGNTYIVDALMGTVRVLDGAGEPIAELAGYGFGTGDVRTPCDIALNADGSRVYVASSNTSSVEVYAAPDRATQSFNTDNSGSNKNKLRAAMLQGRQRATDKPIGGDTLNLNDAHLQDPWGSVPVQSDASMPMKRLLNAPTWDGPHVIDAPVICERCHGNTGQPGGHPGTVEGQGVLCMSCHNTAGQALDMPIHELDLADPFGTNPSAADGRGRSHAWGVPAVNASADSVGPAPGSTMAWYLDSAGNIKCSTCHNQHTETTEAPYLRVSNAGDAMCKECHAPRNEGLGELGTHPVGFDYPGGVGEFPAATGVDPLVIKAGKLECMTCHAPHHADSGGANQGEGDGTLLRGANDETLCQTCHTEHAIHDVRGTWQPTCTDCHEVHDPTSENLSLVARQIGGTGVTFQDNDLGDNGLHDFIRSNHNPASYDGVCEVCHTGTTYHANSAAGDHEHNKGLVCTDCHTHSSGFLPTAGSCTACHSQPMDNGDGIPPGGRRAVVPDGANVNDFGNTSHHVRGDVQNSDCQVCHDMSRHQQGHVRLKDPDSAGLVYDYDTATADDLENFCLNCHDANGAAAGPGTQPFSDGATVPNVKGVSGSMWADSAHKQAAKRCTDCHTDNAHGSDNIKLLQAPGVSALCYQCHTEGMVNNALSGAVNDIQEAFAQAERHNLGTTFTVGVNTYTLECTSCHNPHVVTGKHWDVASGVSPVTRPDLSADPTTNPRAMGRTLWGATAGEKMQDFAAQGPGTGGWYYSTARGNIIAWDQGGYYQPPKAGSGYNFEFDGNTLPDYATLCLDCHTHRMSAANPPVNWGQGIACTGNSVDPPDQRIGCGAQHGLAAANKPSYTNDSGTGGSWGAGGNPDALFGMNYVSRGRGVGHFMRWPYDSAERNAGINFVMSCTDCHEAHGSNAASMLRTTVNAYGAGTSNWNTMCNNCHYYYGGQHAGMSCGNASCHEANSIHRIIHNTASGGTQLQLTSSGNQSLYQAPDFTPEIVAVEGNVGSDELVVTFRENQYGAGFFGLFTNSDLTGALNKNDFRLFDRNSNNTGREILGVTHTAGEYTAVVQMSQPLLAPDFYDDILSTAGKSVWGWYEGGYTNFATGVIPAQEVSAGPWPVTISGGPSLSSAELLGLTDIAVIFDEGVYSSGGGALLPADFTLNCAGHTMATVLHTAGDATAILVLSTPMDGFDIDTCTSGGVVAPTDVAIFNLAGNPAVPDSVPITLGDWACPSGATSFEFSETAGSPFAFDAQNQIIATVGNPTVAFQGTDGFFHGDGTDNSTYLYAENVNACLEEDRTLTYEMRFKPNVVDLDSEENNPGNVLDRTVQTLFDRRYSYNLKVSRADFWGNGNPPPGKAFVYIWYRPDTSPEGGRAWHQAFADNAGCYIEANHWYRLRLVYNADRLGGIPVDFFIDDLGTDGAGTGESWPGFINCTRPPGETDQYRSTEGEEIGPVAGKPAYPFSIGALAANKNYALNGLMDWLSYQPTADYSGVDAPAPVEAVTGDGQTEITWGGVTGATAYNIYWDTVSDVTPATGTLISGVTSPYTHGGLTNGTTFYYIVTALKNVDGVAGDEEIVSSQVKAMPVNAAPGSPPTNVVAEGFKKGILLTWTDAFLATSYNIYWSDLSGVTPTTGTLIAGVTSPTVHLGRTNGTTYYYVITSVNVFGEYVIASTEVSATANLHPTNVATVAGDGQVEISWDAVTGATSYNIYWETDSEVTRATANQIIGVSSPYTHLGLVNGTTYYYIVTAVHPTGETFGPYSVNATPTAP